MRISFKIATIGFITMQLLSCISIYKDEINTPSIRELKNSASYSIDVGDEELPNNQSNNINPDLKTKIKDQIASNITESCAQKLELKNLKITYVTTYESDNNCWLFNLCYIIWPASNTGKHSIKAILNNPNIPLPAEQILFRNYAHILLIPALIYKPFDSRRDSAFLKLADSFSKDLCSSTTKM